MTKAEKRWAFNHAKSHIVDAIKDVLVDEHHSIIKLDGVERRDIQAEVDRRLREFLRLIRAITYEIT